MGRQPGLLALADICVKDVGPLDAYTRAWGVVPCSGGRVVGKMVPDEQLFDKDTNSSNINKQKIQ